MTDDHHQVDIWLRIVEKSDAASRKALGQTGNSQERAHEHEYRKTSMFEWRAMRSMLEPSFPRVQGFTANMGMITEASRRAKSESTAKSLLICLATKLPRIRVVDLRGINFRDDVAHGEAGEQRLALTHIVENDLFAALDVVYWPQRSMVLTRRSLEATTPSHTGGWPSYSTSRDMTSRGHAALLPEMYERQGSLDRPS